MTDYLVTAYFSDGTDENHTLVDATAEPGPFSESDLDSGAELEDYFTFTIPSGYEIEALEVEELEV
jgi:hypothetical protein